VLSEPPHAPGLLLASLAVLHMRALSRRRLGSNQQSVTAHQTPDQPCTDRAIAWQLPFPIRTTQHATTNNERRCTIRTLFGEKKQRGKDWEGFSSGGRTNEEMKRSA
jgi:hypothetical protein